MFCNVLGLFFNKESYSGELVHEFCVTPYIAYEADALGGQDSRRVVVLKIKDKDDDDDDIACTGECLLPLFQNLQPSYLFSENERLKYVELIFYLVFCGCETYSTT
jgi:hypothetical protein